MKNLLKKNSIFITCEIIILIYCSITFVFNSRLEQFHEMQTDGFKLFYFSVLSNNYSLNAFGPLMCYIAANDTANSLKLFFKESYFKGALLIPVTSIIILIVSMVLGSFSYNYMVKELFQDIFVEIPTVSLFYLIHSFVIGGLYTLWGHFVYDLTHNKFWAFIYIIILYHLSQFVPFIDGVTNYFPQTTLNIINIIRPIEMYLTELVFVVMAILLICFFNRYRRDITDFVIKNGRALIQAIYKRI